MPASQYHDDGEKELGPTVAALALGSPSLMKFRPKWKKDLTFPGVKEKKAPGGRGKKCYADVLEVPMKHGDMMVMHGAQIQCFYDVCLLAISRLWGIMTKGLWLTDEW